MSYLDFDTTDDNTKIRAIPEGTWDIRDRAVDIAANVIVSDFGSYKYAPTVGGRARLFLNSTISKAAVIARSFRVAMTRAGFSRPVVDVSKFPDEVNVNTDEILGQ